MGIFSRAPKTITDPPPPSGSPILVTLQTGLRSLQLTAAIAVLAIYSYTLGALSNRGLSTPTDVRAVEGIVGITVGYVTLCIVLLRIFSTRTFPAFVLIVLDVAFAASWIYVATANGGGTSCSGEVNTHFGKGKADDGIKGKSDGFMSLPSYGDACRLLTACLAIAVITIFMFLGSVATTIFLGRAHHTQKRKAISAESLEEPDSFDPGRDSPKPDQEGPAKQKFSLKNLFRRRSVREPDTENALPAHANPHDLSGRRPSLLPDQQYGYVNPDTGAIESDIALSGNRRGYQPVPAAQAQERPVSPETVYTEYDPRRRTPPPVVSHQYREEPYSQEPYSQEPYAQEPYAQEPYSQADMWRPVDITGGGPPLTDTGSARFPHGPYENLRGSSRRTGQGRLPQTAYSYEDGVYDARG